MSRREEKLPEWYGRTDMGGGKCTLCSVPLKDLDAFQVHITGKKHRERLEFLEREKQKAQQEADERLKLFQQQKHQEHQAQLAQLSNESIANQRAKQQQANTVGQPTFRYHVENIGGGGSSSSDVVGGGGVKSRITFTLEYPLVSSGGDGQQPPCRPLHRWMSATEQTVDSREENDKIYLVFACDPYKSISFTFPNDLWIATVDNTDRSDVQTYNCKWDPFEKIYTLSFIIAKK